MADGNVQLRLQASLDLAFLRAQVASIGKSLKTGGVSVVATLDTKQFQKDVAKLTKEIRIKVNDSALDATVNRIKTVGNGLKELQKIDNKVVIGVTAQATVDKKGARKVRADVYRSIMANGGKILLPVGLQPISQSAVDSFKADLQKKLGSISIKVGTTTGTTPATGQSGGARRPSYLDAPAFKTELEKLARATFAQLQKGASGLREGRTRSELERLLSQFAQTNPQGAQRSRDLNALREMLARGRYQQGLGIEARMAGGSSGQGGQFQRTLDTFARGLFRMLGMDPAQLKAEEQARRAAAARAANVPTPFGLLPSVTRRTQTAQGVNAIMQGTGAAGGEDPAGKLALSAETLRRRVDAILAQYFKVVEAQIREDFGGAELRQNLKAFAYMAQALRDAEQRTREARVGDAVHSLFQRVERALNDAARAAESQAIRNVRVVDLNAVPAARPMLPPAGGSGGGRDRVTGHGEPPRPRGGALAFPQTQLPENYLRNVRQSLQLRDAIRGADQYLRQARVPLAGAIDELGGEFAQATKQVLLYGAAYKGLAFFMDLPNQALNAAAALQTFRNQLNAVTGSADNANRSFGFVDGLADRFAVPLASIRQGFVRMYASMEPAGFGASEIEGLFSGISKAAATFGMSREQVDRVTYAFSQMASKGQIMAEELRGQLGDVLPGSLALFAKAAQMELPEFTKAMEDGRFSGEAMRVVLNNVAILLNQQFAKGADGAANTLQGALNQMQNSLQKLHEAFEPLVNEVAQQIFPLISSAIGDATAAVKAFAAEAQGNQGPVNMLSSGARGIYDAMKLVEEVVRAVGGVLQQLMPTLATVGRSIAFVIEQLARLTNTPIGAFLANWLLQTTLLVGAMQLLAKAGILQALAALVRFNGGIIIAIERLKLFILTSNAARFGVVGLGGGLVLAALSSLTQHLEGVYKKMLDIQQAAKNSAQAIAAMSQTEATLRARSVEGEIATLERLQQSTKGVTGGMVSASATETTALARAGASPGVAFTGPLLDEAKGTYGAGFVDPTQVGAAILKLKDDLARLRQQARPVEMPSAALQDIAPSTADTEKTQRRAEAYLDAVKQREEGMAKAREQLEERLADIRKQAAEDVARLEQEYADRRLTLERDIAKVRRDIAFQLQQQALEGGAALRIIQGASPESIDAERQILEARQQLNEEEIARKQQAQDEEIRKARELEDFRTKIAKAINEANLAYAKQVGEVQRAYARNVAKLISDGSGQGARKLEAAGLVVAALLKQETIRQAFSASYPGTALVGSVSQSTADYLRTVDPRRADFLQAFINASKEEELARDALGKSLRTPTASGAGAVAIPRFDAGKFDAQVVAAQKGLDDLRASLEQALSSKSLVDYTAAFTNFINQQEGRLASLVASTREQNADLQAQLELRRSGLRAEEVDGLARARALVDIVDANLRQQIERIRNDDKIAGAQQKAAELEARRLKLRESFTNSLALELAQGRLMQLRLEEINKAEEKINEQRREAIQLIGQSVSGAMSSYKEFLGSIVKGEGMKDAILRLQQAFRDQAVTLFFDFAMKPMEKMLRDQLTAFFGLETEEALLKRLIANAEAQERHLQAIKDNTSGSNTGVPASAPPAADRPAGSQFVNPPSNQVFPLHGGQGGSNDQVPGWMASAPASQQAATGGRWNDYVRQSMERVRQQMSAMQDPAQAKQFAEEQARVINDSLFNVWQQTQQQIVKAPAFSGDKMRPALDQVHKEYEQALGLTDQLLAESLGQLGQTIVNGAQQAVQAAPMYNQAIGAPAASIGRSAGAVMVANQSWQQALGSAVQAIGMAAGAAMSIAAGVGQVKRGGASNVLGGIGSILMGVGGAMGGFGKLGGLFGGGGGGGVSAPNIFSGLPQSSVSMGFAANGAVWKGGFTPFANGGVVQGPTLGLVGEGKYNEAIVPLPDGRSIPVKMAGGQSAREAMQTGGMASAGPSMLSFSFETTNIGGVEYVSRDQLELAMAATRKEAAKEGAKRGMDMTMDKIRNSPAARQNIAMGRR